MPMIPLASDILALASFRPEFLAELGAMHRPTYVLSKLAEFKADIGTIGIPATIEKWQKWMSSKKDEQGTCSHLGGTRFGST